MADIASLDLVQLHGHESAEYCREIANGKTGRPVIKSIAMGPGTAVDVSGFVGAGAERYPLPKWWEKLR